MFQPDLFEEDEGEAIGGAISDYKADEDFLTFPGTLHGLAIKPLIDTGGGCNLIKAQWLREHGFEVNESPSRTQQLLMMDGTKSKGCPVFDGLWKFDDRKQKWKDVEFIVVEGYKYDALIGLPFLKHTETIHNSAGKLVFPEFKDVHAHKGAIPIYNGHSVKPSR